MLNWFAIIWWPQLQSQLCAQQQVTLCCLPLSVLLNPQCFGEGILAVGLCNVHRPRWDFCLLLGLTGIQTLSISSFTPPLSYLVSCRPTHKLVNLILADFFKKLFLFIYFALIWLVKSLAVNYWLYSVTLTQTQEGVSNKSCSILCRS